MAAARRGRLEESHKLQSFYRDVEEEEMWITEKEYSLQSTDYGHDLNSCMILLNKHEVQSFLLFLRLSGFLYLCVMSGLSGVSWEFMNSSFFCIVS